MTPPSLLGGLVLLVAIIGLWGWLADRGAGGRTWEPTHREDETP